MTSHEYAREVQKTVDHLLATNVDSLSQSIEKLSRTANRIADERNLLFRAIKEADLVLLQQNNPSERDREAMEILETALLAMEKPNV